LLLGPSSIRLGLRLRPPVGWQERALFGSQPLRFELDDVTAWEPPPELPLQLVELGLGVGIRVPRSVHVQEVSARSPRPRRGLQVVSIRKAPEEAVDVLLGPLHP